MLYLPCISNFKFPIKICFVLFSRILIKLWSLLPLIVWRSILEDFFLISWKNAFKRVQNTRSYSTCVTFEGLNFNWCLCNKRYRVRLKTFTSTRLQLRWPTSFKTLSWNTQRNLDFSNTEATKISSMKHACYI